MLVNTMGMVFRPRDVARGRKTVLEKAIRVLSLGLKDVTIRILESGVDEKSKQQLVKLLGEAKARHIIQRITDT